MIQTGKEEMCNQYHLLPAAFKLLFTSVWCVFCNSALCVIHCQATRRRPLFLLQISFIGAQAGLVLKHYFTCFWHLLLCVILVATSWAGEQGNTVHLFGFSLVLSQTEAFYTWTQGDINPKGKLFHFHLWNILIHSVCLCEPAMLNRKQLNSTQLN